MTVVNGKLDPLQMLNPHRELDHVIIETGWIQLLYLGEMPSPVREKILKVYDIQ